MKKESLVIYAAFTVWLFGIVFLAMGCYSLLTRLVPPAWVNWALLPGTIVSEMAYIFGCLITGGEIHRAKIMPQGGEGKGDTPGTEAASRLGIVGPIIAAWICIVACGAVIIVAHNYLGQPVMQKFESDATSPDKVYLSQELPASVEGFWAQMHKQLDLLHHTCSTWGRLNWSDWHVLVFVYLALCLAVRLAPAGRPLRATLGAAVLVAAMIAGAGAVSVSFTGLIEQLWTLLTYVWCVLLFLLAVTLLLHGLVALARGLAAKGGGSSSKGGGEAKPAKPKA